MGTRSEQPHKHSQNPQHRPKTAWDGEPNRPRRRKRLPEGKITAGLAWLRFKSTALFDQTIARYVVLFGVVVGLSWRLAILLNGSPAIANLGPPITVAGNEPITPIPAAIEIDQNRARLGQALFSDPQLSGNGSLSCASCHSLDQWGTDNLPRSLRITGEEGSLNAPTVLNSALQFRQFWDGRAEILTEAIDSHIQADSGMGANWTEVVNAIKQSSDYRPLFRAAYGTGPTPETTTDALAEYMISLSTPNARFDQFLLGDANALTNDEKEGYRRFKGYGCAACHQGVLLGGNFFQSFGIFGNYISDRGNETPADLGRFNVTGEEGDRYVFKVPTLRNIEHTAPYFHDGSAETLEDAVSVMVRYQLGRTLDQTDIDLIVQFLKTLTGELEALS